MFAFNSPYAQPSVFNDHRGIFTEPGYGHNILTQENPHWYQLNDIVGTASAPPPILRALVSPNITHTGAPLVELVRPKLMNRPRTRKPFTDGLIGIESNPGPSPSMPKRKPPSKNKINNKIGGRNSTSNGRKLRSVNLSGMGGITTNLGMSYSVGTAYQGRGMRAITSKGTQSVLGSPAHIFVGRCAFQNFESNAGATAVFGDGANNQSDLVYINPRICCQNANYSVPAGMCPIGVIAQPFRRYSFRKLLIHYQPTAANTSTSGVVALAYDPEVVATSSLSNTTMSYANFECSAYGPIWAPLCLDLTPWLDKSRWFYGETPGNIATSLISSQSIQGTLMLLSSTLPGVSTQYGLFFMEFELALSELGPTEVFSAPAFSHSSSSSSSSNGSSSIVASQHICTCKGELCEPADTSKVKEKEKIVVHEEYLVVDGERKLVQSSVFK